MAFNGALTERKEQEQARKITVKTSWNFHFRTKKNSLKLDDLRVQAKKRRERKSN